MASERCIPRASKLRLWIRCVLALRLAQPVGCVSGSWVKARLMGPRCTDLNRGLCLPAEREIFAMRRRHPCSQTSYAVDCGFFGFQLTGPDG